MYKSIIEKWIVRNNILLIITILSFLIRLSFRSNYPDDWDSVQFVLAIENYSISDHQPHPPGYPVYIFFGRVVNILMKDPLKSLVLLSVFFGSLSIAMTYILTEKFFGRNVAALSSIILSLTPAHMLYSEVAMSDIMSLFFIVTIIYLLYMGIESQKYLYIGSFVLGVIIGVRLTDIILLSILFIVFIYRKKLKEIIVSMTLIVIGVSIWLIPIIVDTGLDTLIKLENGQYYTSVYNFRTINLGLLKVFESLNNLLIGGWSYIFYVFVAITLIFVIFKILNNRRVFFTVFIDKRIVFITFWLLIYLISSSLNYILVHERYLLPLYVPLSIIFSYSMVKILDTTKEKSMKISLFVIFMIIVTSMGYQAIIIVHDISITKPAPVQAAEFISRNYDHNDTIIMTKGSYKHLKYYLTNFTFIDLGDNANDEDKIYNYILENKTIISEDFPIIFAPSKTYLFEREKIYKRHEYVTLYENKDIKRQIIILENEGWYWPETSAMEVLRWLENNATFRLYSDSNSTINISFNMISYYSPRTLEIYNNEMKISKVNIPKERVTFVVYMDIKKGFNVIRFYVLEGCKKPSDIPELKNKDNRCLSVALIQNNASI